MPIVYVVQETQHNILPAKEFGQLRIMLLHDQANCGKIGKIAHTLNKELADMQCDDYLLCIGDPINIGLAMHYALWHTSNSINVLTWDKRTMCYSATKIEL